MRTNLSPIGPAILRVVTGAVFIGAGLQKLFGLWGGTGIAGTAALFRAIQLDPAYPLAVFITALELVGGILLVIGALTTWVAVPLVVEMVVAIWKVHFVNGFFLNWTLRPGAGHGYEFNLMLIGSLVCLVCTGPGTFSFDEWRIRRQHIVERPGPSRT